MHIGIDCRLPYYRSGGISQYVVNLVSALVEADASNRYSIFHSRLDTENRIPAGKANVRRVDLDTPCHHRFERLLLGAELQSHALDVLHSPDFIPPGAGARRRIITVHDLGFLQSPEHLTAESLMYYRDQLPWALDAADHVITPSVFTRTELMEQFSIAPGKVTAIPLAANPIYLRPPNASLVAATLERRGLTSGFILFVGTIEPRKNLDTLLEAHRRLSEELTPNVPLVLVGQRGWQHEDILAAVAVAAERGTVLHFEDVDEVELRDLYSAACLLALPSHHEGFGLPALEAMHCGCPVVASRRGALPEVIGDAGILIEPEQIGDWTDALAGLLASDATRTALAAKGRRRAAQFSWRTAAQATLAVYCGAPATE